jgi:hypothetical protein
VLVTAAPYGVSSSASSDTSVHIRLSALWCVGPPSDSPPDA